VRNLRNVGSHRFGTSDRSGLSSASLIRQPGRRGLVSPGTRMSLPRSVPKVISGSLEVEYEDDGCP
jgi:hypothetical protein